MAKKSRTPGKFLAVLLALTLCVSLAAPAFAAGTTVLEDVTASEPTTQAGEAKVRVGLSGVSGSVSIAQVALSFSGALSYKSVEFVNGKDDPQNGYTLAVTPRATANSTHRLTAGLLAVTTPMAFDGDDALFIVTFVGDPGDTVTVTVDAESSYYMSGGANTALPTASVTATASDVSITGKSAAVRIKMDKVTDFADDDLTFLTLTLTDESSGAVITAALDKSYRDGSVTEPTYNVPLAVLEGHTYTVELSGAGYVPYSKTGETFDSDLTITNTGFLPGDVNGDGAVDAADRTAFDELKISGTYAYTIAADFNRDGVVDEHDAAQLPANSGTDTGGGTGGGGAAGPVGGGGGGGGGAAAPADTTMRTVTVQQASGGEIKANAASAKLGDTVTVTLTPAEGNRVSSVSVATASGAKVETTKVSDTEYTFAMPAEEVTVSAAFASEAVKSVQFSDVPQNEYFYDAVNWAVEKGVTTGVGDNRFAPHSSCTRSQAVTFLWRAAGSPEPKDSESFSDVDPNGFYCKAVLWAVENGITAGVGGGRFDPDGECSRAQIVTFLWRFAGKPTAQGGESFIDVSATEYYSDAVTWAQVNGITSGTGDGCFSPERVCDRAQIVTFLYRDLAEKN